jgi:hypothetical protein
MRPPTTSWSVPALIILDENILESQRQWLEAMGVSLRQVGVGWGRKGLQDADIVVALRGLRGSTCFTRDADFYSRDLCHRRYCLGVVAAGQHEVAAFVRRVLKHHAFDTRAKRMGRVLRISWGGIVSWQLQGEKEIFEAWKD